MFKHLTHGDYTLISMRDPGLPTYTWCWIKEEKDSTKLNIISPYFNSQDEASIWADNNPRWTIDV